MANWIAGATKNKGALHRALGVPTGEKIPAKKLAKAAGSSNPRIRKEAALAKTLKKLSGHKEGGAMKKKCGYKKGGKIQTHGKGAMTKGCYKKGGAVRGAGIESRKRAPCKPC